MSSPMVSSYNKVDDFLNRLLYNEHLQEKLSSCKTKNERIEFLKSIRSNMKPWDQAMIDRRPDWIRSIQIA